MVGSTFTVDPSIPADQAMLLRLIDSKFETTNTKIEGIASTLQVMNDRFGLYDKRFDNHEHRLGDMEAQMLARKLLVDDFNAQKLIIRGNSDAITVLEKWQTEEQTTTRNASKWGSALWGLVGSGVTAGVLFLTSLFFQSQPAAVPASQHWETTTHTQTQAEAQAEAQAVTQRR